MRDILLALIIGGCLPVILFRPFFGLLVWCWISYMAPHRLTYGFMHDLPIAMVVGGAFLASFLFSKESKRLPINAVVIALMCLIAWFLIGQLFSPPLKPDGDGAYELSRMLKVQTITFITMMMLNTRERINQMLAVMVGSITFYGIKGGLFTILTGGSYLVWGPPGASFEGNTELALVLVMMIPLMRYFQTRMKAQWQRHLMTGAMLLCAASVLGSFSRGALLAISAMGLFMWLKSRQKIMLGVILICVGSVGFTFMPERWHERMATIFDDPEDKDASAKGRVNAWWFAYFVAKEEVFGGGFDTYTQANFYKYDPHDGNFDPENFHDAHSIYFQMLGEHGFFGLFLFLNLGALSLLAAGRAARRARQRPELFWARDLGTMLQVSLVGYASGGAFLGLGYFDVYYHLIAAIVALNVVVERELKQLNAASAPRLSGEPEASVERPRFAGMPGLNVPARR